MEVRTSSQLCFKVVMMAKKKPRSPPPPPSSSSSSKDSDQAAPRITSNVKQNLQLLKIWKELHKKSSTTPRPVTSFRKKKVQKEELLEDTELHSDPDAHTTLYYPISRIGDATPVLLVDGYNVCGYWPKLKDHFMNGRLHIARQQLVDELASFGCDRGVKVVVVFDAKMSGLPTRKESFSGVDVVFATETSADLWIEKEVEVLRKDGCPKVWVATSDHSHQHAAHGAGAYVWSCKKLIAEIKSSRHEVEKFLKEQRNSFHGSLFKNGLDPKVVGALKDLRQKLAENESKNRRDLRKKQPENESETSDSM